MKTPSESYIKTSSQSSIKVNESYVKIHLSPIKFNFHLFIKILQSRLYAKTLGCLNDSRSLIKTVFQSSIHIRKFSLSVIYKYCFSYEYNTHSQSSIETHSQ